jgi:hypothetical protein
MSAESLKQQTLEINYSNQFSTLRSLQSTLITIYKKEQKEEVSNDQNTDKNPRRAIKDPNPFFSSSDLLFLVSLFAIIIRNQQIFRTKTREAAARRRRSVGVN